MELSRLSTCTFPFRERPIAEVLPIFASAGYKRIDLLGRMPHFSLDPDEFDLEQFRALLAQNELAVANLGTYVGVGFASESRAEQEAALDEVKKTIDIAASFNARSIRVFRPNSEIDNPAMIDRIVPWLQKAAEYGAEQEVYMGFENHGGPLCGDPEHCRTLSQAVGSPYFGVLYDPCNLMGAGVDYQSALLTMKDHITHVHFKDGAVDDGGFRRTMLGEGDIDFGWIVAQLNEIGYSGTIATEYELSEPAPEDGLPVWLERYKAL